MGCTSSKENTNPPTATTAKLTDNDQQLINEQFHDWLKSHRTKADDYVLQDIRSTGASPHDIDDYRIIVRKALDLLADRHDIKTANKLSKLVQKEVPSASPDKVAHTIDILKQTAEKLRRGQIQFDNEPHVSTSNGQLTNVTSRQENKSSQLSSGEPGIALKQALETARILFYKGKQAAIFATPNGGYDVRILDEHDDVLKEDGNLLRSIIVTEVNMRPKPSPQFTVPSPPSPPPPPPVASKLLDEHEIGVDFRRSIDAALKGLEAIYQPPSQNHHPEKLSATNSVEPTSPQHINQFIVDSEHEIGNSMPRKSSSFFSHDVQVTTSDDSARLSHLPTQVQGNSPVNCDSSSPISSTPVILSNSPTTKSASHNVTYTEIIHSESRDGEQSRRMKTESYDDHASNDHEQPTTLKVITKSQFSTHPSSGEKTMEQSVQVISVKVRNETTTITTGPSDHQLENDKVRCEYIEQHDLNT